MAGKARADQQSAIISAEAGNEQGQSNQTRALKRRKYRRWGTRVSNDEEPRWLGGVGRWEEGSCRMGARVLLFFFFFFLSVFLLFLRKTFGSPLLCACNCVRQRSRSKDRTGGKDPFLRPTCLRKKVRKFGETVPGKAGE